MFQNIGDATIPTASDYGATLAELLPVLKDGFSELRRRTVRFSKSFIDIPELPLISAPDVQGALDS
jgi:hypothetical protein